MSLAAIRAALEAQLDTALSISIAWENVDFTPVAGAPYAQAFLLAAEPDNPEIGPGYIERGLFQANLFYPKGTGPAAATTAAEAIRAAFPYGSSLALGGGGAVNIINTPEIGPARAEDDRFMVPVKTRFRAWIAS